jgi:D-serine deaminase-like pyridoxal phosphate-dependent protein
MGRIAAARGATLGVLVELNIGMDRAGVHPGRSALELARLVASTPGLKYRGIMGWEGHCCSILDREERRREILRSMGHLTGTAELLRREGLPPEIVSCGGSATFYVSAHEAGVTEVEAGGGMFSDVTCEAWGVQTRPAVFVRATVTSRPAPDRLIVDAGFKALPTWSAPPRAIGVDGIVKYDSCAEHLALWFDAPQTRFKVGDGIDFEPGYGDATVFLHDRMYGVRNGIVEVEWRVQGRGKLQ